MKIPAQTSLKKPSFFRLSFYAASLVIVPWLFITLTGSAKNDSAKGKDITSQVDEYMAPYIKNGYFSGGILVARDGKVLVKKGYGMANLEHDIPITSKTKFRLGSMTKQFTAMGIIILQEKGKLNVKDLINKYLPNCPESLKDITIHHLLTHTSGIPKNAGGGAFPDKVDPALEVRGMPFPVEKFVASFKDKALESKPGEKYEYSNTGYILLGCIIEKVSGKPYDVFLRENIFEPLGMKDTEYDSNRAIMKNRASGYNSDWQNALFYEPKSYSAGALCSTLDDMYLWSQALGTEKLVSKKAIDAVITPYVEAVSDAHKDAHYGYGWMMDKAFGRKRVFHGGSIMGFKNFICLYPDDKVTIIVLCNRNPVAPKALVEVVAPKDLAAIVFGEKYEIPKERHVVKVDPKIYDDYVGTYEGQGGPQKRLRVVKKDDQLMIKLSISPEPVQVFPESETEFFYKNMDYLFRFVKEDSKVTKIILCVNGEESPPAKKID